jgi:hypothetical protein
VYVILRPTPLGILHAEANRHFRHCHYGESCTPMESTGYGAGKRETNDSGQPNTWRETLTHKGSTIRSLATKSKSKFSELFGLVASLLVLCFPSFAALGDDVSSVQADQAHIQASRQVTDAHTYAIHELRSPSGAVIREFVSPVGKVFAVAWHAPTLPDMKQLLGSHFEEFQQAVLAQKSRGRRGPLVIHQPGLAVELGGHMRSFAGRAYLPDQVPANVRAEDIR